MLALIFVFDARPMAIGVEVVLQVVAMFAGMINRPAAISSRTWFGREMTASRSATR